MCVWGGKLEAYQLLQRSGKEPFSIKRVRTAGRANLECCSRSEGMDLVFLINGRVATAGIPRTGDLKEEEKPRLSGGKGACSVAHSACLAQHLFTTRMAIPAFLLQ